MGILEKVRRQLGLKPRSAPKAGAVDLRIADASTIRDKPTGLIFPIQVQSWTRGEVMSFRPPLGFSVAYFHPAEITATLFVYDFGERSIPNGPSSAVVKEHFMEAIRDIRVLAQRGKATASGPLRMDLPEGMDGVSEVANFQWASLELNGSRGPAGIALGVTGYRNHFIKLRLNYRISESGILQETVSGLLRKIMQHQAVGI